VFLMVRLLVLVLLEVNIILFGLVLMVVVSCLWDFLMMWWVR